MVKASHPFKKIKLSHKTNPPPKDSLPCAVHLGMDKAIDEVVDVEFQTQKGELGVNGASSHLQGLSSRQSPPFTT